MNSHRSDLTEVLIRLPRLTQGELAQVMQRLTLLKVGVHSSPPEPDGWFLLGVAEELRRRGLWGAGPLPQRLFTKDTQEYAARAEQHILAGYASLTSKGTGPERAALAIVVSRCLLDYLLRGGVPLSPKVVLANLDKVPVALEASYPGYWASKLLHALFDGPAQRMSK